MCGRWLEEVLKYSSWSFGFLYGLYVPSNKLDVTSKKSTISKFVFILILKPAFLKFYCVFSYSICFLFICISQKYQFIIPTHTSRFFYQVYLIIKIVYECRKTRRFRHHQNCPWWRQTCLLYFFIPRSILLHNKDCLQCFITRLYKLLYKSFSGISLYFWSRKIRLSSISLDIEE